MWRCGKLADKDSLHLDPFSSAKSKKNSAMGRMPIESMDGTTRNPRIGEPHVEKWKAGR